VVGAWGRRQLKRGGSSGVTDLGCDSRTKLEGDHRRSNEAWGCGQQPTMELEGVSSSGGGSWRHGLRGEMRELAGTSSSNSPHKAHRLPLFGDGRARATGQP
jgi:hypothetical protein